MKIFAKLFQIKVLVVFFFAVAAAQGKPTTTTTITLQDQQPSSAQDANNAINKGSPSAGLPFIQNDTFLTDPSSILGSVLVLRKSNSSSTVQTPSFEWTGFQNITYGTTKYNFDNSVSTLTVNKDLALSVSFLSFFSGQLSLSNVFSMTIKNELIQRVADDDKWRAAYPAWRALPDNARLFSDPDVTKILVVRGFVLKSFVYKDYEQVGGDAKGAYGVSVDGKGYYSSDESKVDYLWGIDYAVLYSRPENITTLTAQTFMKSWVHAPAEPSPSEIKTINSNLSGSRVSRVVKLQ